MTLPLLVPMEWPVQHPSAIAYIVLLLVLPLGFGAVVTLIAFAPSLRRSLDAPDSSRADRASAEPVLVERSPANPETVVITSETEAGRRHS
ncbi:MAG TPA: hypothetical protein VFK68_02335 [Propionibacteriaceae bacterium]|nr:hypothetical protein [Propionibacteriaceae bacterium]